MKYTTLPNTDIKISKTCLGTMTFGQQNSEADGHAQMDYALEKGINFFDTAEMYSVPGRKETYGSTEKIIGTWFKKTGKKRRNSFGFQNCRPESGLGLHSRKYGFFSGKHCLVHRQKFDSPANRLYRFVPIALART